ncbi:unnamed protein product [Mycena citricolor]|uniref:F-box domain-containing protein n=1 Tax=Mycena citricolor TaxID=2018698 RepID=A0AAD2Q3Z4_9AGAR|nr:unnamed protein product [Mycena citricolor]
MALETIPTEVLERIAFAASAHPLPGPPTALARLQRTSRTLHTRLCPAHNAYLHARVFAAKFDPPRALLRDDAAAGAGRHVVLARELERQFVLLGRLRRSAAARERNDGGDAGEEEEKEEEEEEKGWVREALVQCYLMMLENEGKNEVQLDGYGGMGAWVRRYLFDPDHGLFSASSPLSVMATQWPVQTVYTACAMWLFWFLLRPDELPEDDALSWNILNTLKIFALAAHKYPIAHVSWAHFHPPQDEPHTAATATYYSDVHRLRIPPVGAPTILSFLSIVNLKTKFVDFSAPPYASTAETAAGPAGPRWASELARCLSISRPQLDTQLQAAFRPGSIDGTWEGIFTYTEFATYAAMLQGAPPPLLQKCVIVRHRQTWMLREYHFVGNEGDDKYSDAPLSAGDPRSAYVPISMRMQTDDGLEFVERAREKPIRYRRASKDTAARGVQDIIIAGEGHSAWGQFGLVGRVRPCDGFVALCKDYMDQDRGKWVYSGFLVGNAISHFAGRWRDTISDPDEPGYEGCFLMARRQ